MKYDLIIIGGGSGGFASAIQANELGLKTLLLNSSLPVGEHALMLVACLQKL